MKTGLIFLSLIFLMLGSAIAQFGELGLHYQPNKFHLTNAAEKEQGSEYSELPATLKGSNCVGFFFNKLLNKQNGLQVDIDFMNQKQYYNFSSLTTNKSSIYTKLNTINLGLSHNLYLWEYENDDNVFFSYGVSVRGLINYTDFYNVEIETKVNGVVEKETKTSIIENNKLVYTDQVMRNDTIVSMLGDVKLGNPRYSTINVGANFGLHFLHYFSDNFAFSVGAKGIIYFMDPEEKSSIFWSSTSKYKFGNTPTSETREASKMSSFGVSLSIIYCIGR